VEDTTREAIVAAAPHALRSPMAGVSGPGSAPATGKSLMDMLMGPGAEAKKQQLSFDVKQQLSFDVKQQLSLLM
jgi:hypothetical protein